jgi:hypothetical protein
MTTSKFVTHPNPSGRLIEGHTVANPMESIASPARTFVHQIFYDERSRSSLDPGFAPLDNSSNARPDWYEFWPIRNYLKGNALEPDAWYGFLSPRFGDKTGWGADTVMQALHGPGVNCDVALFSPAWDQLAYFRNPFEQGEAWHPGLLQLSQAFFDSIGITVDLGNLVTYSKTSVFSNYVIAKPVFWNAWLRIADRFFDFVEANAESGVNRTTCYGLAWNQAPIKTFIQERIATIVLSHGRFKVLSPDQSLYAPLFGRLFRDDARTRRQLQVCDFLKERYCRTLDPECLGIYYKVRNEVEYRAPAM